MLALTITPAYKKNGEIVLDKAQYERNTRVMRQHLANGMLVEEYSAQKKREALQTHQNPNKCGVLRGEFDEKDQLIRAQIAEEDKKQRGNLWNLDPEQEKQLLKEEREKAPEMPQVRKEQESLNKLRDRFGLEPGIKPEEPKAEAPAPSRTLRP